MLKRNRFFMFMVAAVTALVLSGCSGGGIKLGL